MAENTMPPWLEEELARRQGLAEYHRNRYEEAPSDSPVLDPRYVDFLDIISGIGTEDPLALFGALQYQQPLANIHLRPPRKNYEDFAEEELRRRYGPAYREQGLTDEDIATRARTAAGRELPPQSIGRYNAGPEAHGDPEDPSAYYRDLTPSGHLEYQYWLDPDGLDINAEHFYGNGNNPDIYSNERHSDLRETLRHELRHRGLHQAANRGVIEEETRFNHHPIIEGVRDRLQGTQYSSLVLPVPSSPEEVASVEDPVLDYLFNQYSMDQANQNYESPDYLPMDLWRILRRIQEEPYDEGRRLGQPYDD